jgi:hypothetical protein
MLGFQFIKDFLVNDKAPFVVTLFVAALSWTAIRTSDRLASIPFVEYHVEHEANRHGISGVALRLRNITAASKFDCFLVTLSTRPTDSLKFGDPTKQQHQLRGTVFATLEAKASKPGEWNIEARDLGPGADISIFIPTTGTGEPALLGSACAQRTTVFDAGQSESAEKKEKPKSAPAAVPILVERSVSTQFVEHEIAILWLALTIWFILMLALFATAERAAQMRIAQKPQEVDHDATG